MFHFNILFYFCEFDQAIIDINWGYTTVDYEGSGNNFVPSVSLFYEQESEKIGAAFLRALHKYNVPQLDTSVALFRPKLNIEFTFSGGRQVDIERNRRRWTYPIHSSLQS